MCRQVSTRHFCVVHDCVLHHHHQQLVRPGRHHYNDASTCDYHKHQYPGRWTWRGSRHRSRALGMFFLKKNYYLYCWLYFTTEPWRQRMPTPNRPPTYHIMCQHTTGSFFIPFSFLLLIFLIYDNYDSVPLPHSTCSEREWCSHHRWVASPSSRLLRATTWMMGLGYCFFFCSP